jgi:outer membrane protein assembly factor BamE
MLRSFILVLSVFVLSFGLSACSLIYKLPTRQGNVIEQKQLDQLKLGMSHEQVKFLLGTPIAASPYAENRWDYFGYYKSPRGQITNRTVSLYFNGDKLTQMEGIQLASSDAKMLDTPDVDSLIKQEKKDKIEKGRADSEHDKGSGINIPAPGSGSSAN